MSKTGWCVRKWSTSSIRLAVLNFVVESTVSTIIKAHLQLETSLHFYLPLFLVLDSFLLVSTKIVKLCYYTIS